MFDIGFSELMLIGIVALIVIGPERLPKVARTLGHLLGRAQRYVNDVKSDICLLYTSPSPRDRTRSRMPSSA